MTHAKCYLNIKIENKLVRTYAREMKIVQKSDNFAI
jgi:hypothetical protein